MYEQDIIFGPLTLKQFLTLLMGVVLIYFINKYSGDYIIIGAIILAMIFLIFHRFKNKKIPIEELDVYFKQKKSEMTEEEYRKMIEVRIANLETYMNIRKQRNLIADEDTEKVLEMLRGL